LAETCGGFRFISYFSPFFWQKTFSNQKNNASNIKKMKNTSLFKPKFRIFAQTKTVNEIWMRYIAQNVEVQM